MRLRRRILFTAAAILVALFLTPSAQAVLANRVFVSARSGNDANPCNNILTPCQTFAGAVLQLNPGGEAIVLDSGGYGPVTITQAVTIEAPPGVLAFIHPPSGDAITINAGAGDTVILRGLTLNGGTGNGITANTVGQLFVEHCTITGYGSNGIRFSAAGGTLFMRDDDVRGCGLSGLLVTSSGTAAHAVIRDSYFAGNYRGVWCSDNSYVAVTDSVAEGNIAYGLLSMPTGSTAYTFMTLDRVKAVSNGTGLYVSGPYSGPANLEFANCFVAHNSVGVDTNGYSLLQGSTPATSLIVNNGSNNLGVLSAGVSLQ
jgi:hypothetical protein